jgi:hypothetical protein
MLMRRALFALLVALFLVACGVATGSPDGPEVTATPPPFAQPADGGAPSSSVIERAVVPVTTPGGADVVPNSEATPDTSADTTTDVVPEVAPDAPPVSDSGDTAAAPVVSGGTFDLVPVNGVPDRPDYLHADLNLDLRGYTVATASGGLVDYDGDTDPNAPKLGGLFNPSRLPTISTAYQVYQWIWDPALCEGVLHGCRGGPDDTWEVTLAGFATSPGEGIYPPGRGPEVYTGGFVAIVLYAAESRITLAYTGEDTVAIGYAVHIENVCVDPGLLALYRAQTDANGWHVTGQLPGLRNDEYLGYACGGEIQVAIRDNGTFMDPRSRKDWW